MPEFILDTSGQVNGVQTDPQALAYARRWHDLDAFTQGYIEALFFTENAPGVTTEEWESTDPDEREGSFPEDAGFADLAPDALAHIIADCRAFQTSAAYKAMQDADDQSEFPDNAPSYECDRHAGRDFWYTRNGHGCGFWDGDWPEPYASQLTEAAKKFGEVDAYLGDDGRVYLD